MSKHTKVNTNGLSYESIKKVALNAEAIPLRTQLSDINIDKYGQMFVKGVAVASDSSAIDDLYKILNLNPVFIARFGKLTGEESKAYLIKMMQNALALQDVKKEQVTLLANPATKLVTNILPGNRDFISNSFALDMFERIMNQYPSLQLKNFQLNGTGIDLSLTSKVIHQPSGKDGLILSGEEYNAGIHLVSSPVDGMSLQNYVERLVCSNGMTAFVPQNAVTLRRLNDKALEKFFSGIAKLSDNNFVSNEFTENLDRAIHTNVSFSELSKARSILLGGSSLTDSDLNRFLPEFSQEVRKLASKGVDYLKCTDMQLKNYPVNVKMWDVVNHVTYFGSHDHGFSENQSYIQKGAGKLFGKKVYDTENLLPILNIGSN